MEAEFHLVEASEAERSPVGHGREDPEGLPEPKYEPMCYLPAFFISS